MTALQYQIFDDLLIGNFMKVTLHGDWGPGRLYPDFSPWVAKYGDNGRAHTLKSCASTIGSYFRRAPADYLRHRFETGFLMPLQEATSSALRSRWARTRPSSAPRRTHTGRPARASSDRPDSASGGFRRAASGPGSDGRCPWSDDPFTTTVPLARSDA